MNRFWLGEQLPDLAEDLDAGFRRIGRDDLADRVWDAKIIEPCSCGSESCGTFFTVPTRIWRRRVERFFDIPDVDGLISVDVVNGQLACVELIGRPDICQKLVRMFSFGLSDE